MLRTEFVTVGVVGVGTIGAGAVVDLAMHGIHVVAVDISERQLSAARDAAPQMVQAAMLLNKRAPRVQPREAAARIIYSNDLEAMAGCDFVFENIIENTQAKRDIYRKLSSICPPDVCFAANTSCVSITELASFTDRAGQVIGVHLMNPVYLKDCAEVIRGFHTTEGTVEATKALLRQTGKDAVVVNDYPGFVSNRISHLFMNEAAFVVQDQVADPKEVDEIFRRCFGHKMGPLETADLIGLDTVMNSLDVLYQSYQDPKFRCAPILRKMVSAGRLGRKSGHGFFKYPK